MATQAQDLPAQLLNTAPTPTKTTVAPVKKGEHTYLMSAFMATSQNTLSLFSSNDGINFTTLASEVYTPTKELLRDPSIMRAADGLYYIAYTTNWSGQTFGIAKSANLKQWTHVADITVPLAGVKNVWAPEWFRDKDGRWQLVVQQATSTTGF